MPRLAKVVNVPLAPWLLGALLLAGCSGGGSQPLSPTPEGAGILPGPKDNPAGGTIASIERGELLSIPGGYTLEVTTAPLAAQLTPWRNNQGLQGNVFDLDVDQFLAGDTITITGVRLDIDGNVQIDYVVKHPFGAPNFANPITAANRADLGFTGRVLFLTDVDAAQVPNQTFFTGVVANTEVIMNADAYVDPGDLLANGTDFEATAFPYKLVVDEARFGTGNRVQRPNGGNPEGNYDPSTGGWQRGNIGVNRDNWLGYDFLHQGQSARNSVVLNKDAVAGNRATFDIALFIKYTDPRGVPFPQNRNVRFPQEPADPALFAYRLPNGALDASMVQVAGTFYQEVDISETTGASLPLSVEVRDWDAEAVETTQTELDNDPDISHVNIGTSGAPELELSIPALSTTPVSLTAGGQSGLPGDEIVYAGTLTNSRGISAAGTTQYGLFRAEDPENTAPGRNTYHFGVDPFTVVADPSRAIDVITYQALRVAIQSSNVAPTCGTLAINGSSTIGVGGSFTVDLAGAVDSNADTLTIGFRYTGPASSSTSNLSLTDLQRAGEGMFNPFTDSRLSTKLITPQTPGAYTLEVTLDDGEADPLVCTDIFTVVANSAASCGTTGINESGPFPIPVAFTLDLSSIADADSADLILRFSYTGPESDISSDLLIATVDLPAETAFDPFDDPRLVFPLRRPEAAGSYQFLVEISDGDASTSCGPFDFEVESAPNLPPDCGTFASQFPKTMPPSGSFTVDLSGNSDPDSSSLTFTFAYTGPGTATSGQITFTLGQLAGETAFNPFTDGRLAPPLLSPTVTGDYNLTVSISDGVNDIDCGPFAFTVEGAPNVPPDCGAAGINGTGSIPADGDFTVDLSSVTDLDSATLTIGFAYTGPETSTSDSFSIAVVDLPAETAFNPFTDGRLTLPLARPQTEGTYQLTISLDDGVNQVSCGPFTFTVEGAAGPPDCGPGITLSEDTFLEGDIVDFTVDLSGITDPDSLTALITFDYTGPSSSATNTITVPYPLSPALNPFGVNFSTPLVRPTAVGTYILTATIADPDDNTTECITSFTINPTGTPDAVTDIDVEVNHTTVPAGGATINTTDTLTVTWAEDNAPEYAIYADLNAVIDLDPPPPGYDPTLYEPDFPELNDELELIGVSATNSFTGFEIDPLKGWLVTYIVVRARAIAGDPGSELADSEAAHVGILADIEIQEPTLLLPDPFWFFDANGLADPIQFAYVTGGELNTNWIGFQNLIQGSVAGIAALNVPIPLQTNLDRAILSTSFMTTDWDVDEEQGEVGAVFGPGFSTSIWTDVQTPGEDYTLIDDDIEVYLTGVPPASNNVHEEPSGTTGWKFRRYEGANLLGSGGSVVSMAYSFANLANTTELVGWDEVSWVYD